MRMSKSTCGNAAGCREQGLNMREQSGVQVRGEGVEEGHGVACSRCRNIVGCGVVCGNQWCGGVNGNV